MSPESKNEIENFVQLLMGTSSSNPQFYYNLAYFYKEAKQYDKAKAEIQIYYEMIKNSKTIQNDPSLLTSAKNKLDQFLEDLEARKNMPAQ
jgi:hypothetical protein